MENKNLQVIYTYLVENVEHNDLRTFLEYLRDFVFCDSLMDYELTTDDYNETACTIATSHGLTSNDSINNLINELSNYKGEF